MKGLCAAILCAVVACPALAQVSVWGDGGASCGEYLQAAWREHNSSQPNDPKGTFRDFGYYGFATWQDGFFSALDLTEQQATGVVTDAAGRNAWLESYCQSHPTASFYEAVLALWKFLHGR
jgi:hypothetical protein